MTRIEKFNEAKKAKKEMSDAEIDKLNDEFNDMLHAIEKHFMSHPDLVTKAFGHSMKDLFSGKFVCSKALDYADEAKIKKVFKKLGLDRFVKKNESMNETVSKFKDFSKEIKK